MLTEKKAELKGFSIYVDWEKTNDPEFGGIDLAKLREEDKNYDRYQNMKLEDRYFRQILDSEFEGNIRTIAKHKYIIEDLSIAVLIKFNKDKKNPSRPATMHHP